MERVEMPKVSESYGYRIFITRTGYYLAREERKEAWAIFQHWFSSGKHGQP